ncbi:PHP domain-containing protein [Candidatus Phytoplasma melaleucae]|uniref:DNA polymerase III PolC-type n=1 Tax=Candidatus Phytoplasma melaleucae TaxID=2982630 RepID=A0ABT9DFA6_9MOLU|nr:PHP domain-containing protein ['Melaleuca sp.' phytoplasma]MDO8167936.1 PHP domain-containing protein ['Melaleuca sp.' phytoplasma]
MSLEYKNFINILKSIDLPKFDLKEVLVNKLKNSWTCFFEASHIPIQVEQLDLFAVQFKNFFHHKTRNLIKQLNIDIRWKFSYFDHLYNHHLWPQKFKYMLNKIIDLNDQNKIYRIFDKIPLIDTHQRIFQFHIETQTLEIISQDITYILKKLQTLFELNYGINFDFKLKNDILPTNHMLPASSSVVTTLAEHNDIVPEILFQDIPISKEKLKLFKQKYKKIKIKGYVQLFKDRNEKIKNKRFTFYLVEPETKQDSILVSKFFNNAQKHQLEDIKTKLKEGLLIEIVTSLSESKQEFYFNLESYVIIDATPYYMKRIDDYCGKKRIEFHLHTKMSNLDAVTSAKDYIETAERWQHEAIAFTDHNGVYAYPEINRYIQGKKIKPILGVELDFIEEKPIFVTNQEFYKDQFSDFILQKQDYVVLDIETTGFSKTRDKIIEIAAIKIENGVVTDQIFHEFVNPEVNLSSIIQTLTHISNEDLQNKPNISIIMPKFLKFIKGYNLVAHNVSFDIEFLREVSRQLCLKFPAVLTIDTLSLAQKFFSKSLKTFSLKNIVKALKVKSTLEGNYHSALFDANATVMIFMEMLEKLKERQITNLFDLKGALDNKYERPYHISVIVKNQVGYRNLFYLLSCALTKDFYKKPRLLKSNLEKHREGLIIGSGCCDSNIFNIALNQNDEDLQKAIAFYDYIEIQPISAYRHIIYELDGDSSDNYVNGIEIIKQTIIKIISEAQKQNKIVIATGDVHYLYPHEKIYREIYINAKLIGGGLHRLSRYKTEYLPDNYLLTTQEMLDAFDFIEDERIKQDIVINNTHLLNQQIEKIEIFPQKLFYLPDDTFNQNLQIPSIQKEMHQIIALKIKNLYGEIIHPLVQKRINQELRSILGNEKKLTANHYIAPIYYLSYLLAKKSMQDGYSVGSRGSIGSSLIANILGITEVNPLRPHYRCSKCQYTVMKMSLEEQQCLEYQQYQNDIYSRNQQDNNDYNFITNFFSGYDLPNMNCPFCFIRFHKDGQDIPFETFLGFEGNKMPDIDLNFAGDYQSKAHDYIKELLGENNVFRAGTIQTVAQRNAYGYVKGFHEVKGLEGKIRFDEINRRVNMIEGVKRSTGQHPGGIIVVPKDNSIYEITPIQFPADDITSLWKTTHFDYHSFEKNLFKIDILGHDDPTLIKFFMDYVEQYPMEFPFTHYQDIPIDDPKVYQIFSNDEKHIVSSIAIPEFGTHFVREMLKDIYQKEHKLNFATLVKVSGLSHGTNVWFENAQDILRQTGDFISYKNEKISFNDIISCRDEIMNTLIQKGISPLKAFETMEFVRKGKQYSYPLDWKKLQKILIGKIPNWYIKSLTKIKYLFPKAHAVAYVLMAVRIAWFKVHHPLLFYSGYFSKRTDQFDYDTMLKSTDEIENKLKELNAKNIVHTVKTQNMINTLTNSLEMKKRGYVILPIDLNKSEANIFVMEKPNALRMPFIAIDGLGQIGADNIVKNRKEKLFSQQDFLKRVKINKTILKKFQEELKLIEKLPEA